MKKLIPFVAAFLVVAVALKIYQGSKPVEQAYKGWPSRTGSIDIRKGFANPPKGYGNVPFYWWTGDSLNLDRLTEQLNILADASTDGLNISYNHTHSEVDTVLNAAGHGWCGRVQGGAPRVFSDEWWNIWNKFSARCAQKGVGLGMDDYVVAWRNNGEYIDTILALPEIAEHQGRLSMAILPAESDSVIENVVSRVHKEGSDSVYVVYSVPAPELAPTLGKKMIEYYFDQYVAHMDEEGLKGMNYFFQDELNYELCIENWTPNMPEEFQKRKGYDVLPKLPALFCDFGHETAKTRLDYAQVVTELAEERYFEPIYKWCADRGLIYGSDNVGRGLNPTQYLDYFQVEKWFTAPGNDAPARGSSFTQTKVSSSISHLYQRPRAWLEAFHSMGWDANGALLTYQLDHHLIAGGNLLCMHGLYYSTHGGWWEWAPPSFHFRMPYWPHMKVWLKYAERLCFVLSQGEHVADVAVLYPTETLQGCPGSSPQPTFSITNELSPHGCDYDFVDFSSLQNATIEDSCLCMAGEKYKVLVLADTRALHEETLARILEFAQKGGIVVAMGNLMPELAECSQIHKTQEPKQVLDYVREKVPADFLSSSSEGRVLHRRVKNQDVYMVMDVPRGDEIFFRAHGKVEIWDAQHGTIEEAEILRTDENGTWLRHEVEKNVSRLYVFSPGKPKLAKEDTQEKKERKTVAVEGEWNLEIIPTMDNKWGDYRLPESEGCIGVEAREMQCTFVPGKEQLTAQEINALQETDAYVYGYGTHMKTKNFDTSLPIDKVMSEALQQGTQDWDDYAFSWQYGVFDSPGGQGYHGLKAKVDYRFLILDQGAHQLFSTRVYSPEENDYKILQEGVKPYAILVDGEKKEIGNVHLSEGWHNLLLAYPNTEKQNYSLPGMRSSSVDKRQRSMVVFYPLSSPEPQIVGEYEHIVASKWYQTEHLSYDCRGGEDGVWVYKFRTAPGTKTLKFKTNGNIQSIYVDGKQLTDSLDDEGMLVMQEVNSGISEVSIVGKPSLGFPGASFFQEPVALTCEGGRAEVGDWTEWGAMKFYSGGVRYTKDVELDVKKGQKVLLDLGEVDATCEVAVNGKFVDVLINKPCVLDISKYVKNGKNQLEVLVYSSLANHYQTIPSPYKGNAHAGLIGPVKLEIE